MNNELYHYGIPGMRWGKRKTKIERISYRSKKKGWSDDATEAAKIKTKKINQMSNSELRKLNDRKQLEQNYNKLNPNAFKKGLLIIGGTAATLGSIAAIKKNSPTLLKKGASVVNNAFMQVGKKSLNRVNDWVVKGVRF